MNGTPALNVPEKVQSAQSRGKQKNPIRIAVSNTIKAMIEQGSSTRKIAAALCVSKTTVQRVRDEMTGLRPAEDLKSGLMSPVRDENAGKLIDHFIGKGLKMRIIKGSDALGAVKLYADRRWPAQQAAPPGPRVSFIQINVDCLRSDLPDAHPTTICSNSEGGKIEIDVTPCNITDTSVP